MSVEDLNNWEKVKLLVTNIVFKHLESVNISSVYLTAFVLKEDKSKEVNFSQYRNIPVIYITDFVLKEDKLRDFKFLQPENIYCISVTCSVLKLDKSRDVNL